MKQINYKLGNKTLIGSALLTMLFFLLCSCGSRKVERSKTEIKETTNATIKIVDSSKTVTTIDSNIKVTDLGTTEEITFEPVDNSKPIIVNGKSYLNVKLAIKKSKTNKVTTSGVKVSKSTQKSVKTDSKANSSKSVKVEQKQSDKKQFNFLSLWWLLIPIALAILYYKKFGFRLP